MNRSAKVLLVSLLLTAASFATCHFGVQHEINKIPPETRAGMADFDWVGVEWISRGLVLLVLAFASGAAGIVIWVSNLMRKGKQVVPG